jgi:hypothetical protein
MPQYLEEQPELTLAAMPADLGTFVSRTLAVGSTATEINHMKP